MATAIHILSWINMIRNTWRVTVGTSIKHSGPTLLQNLTTFFVSHIVSFDYSDKDRLVTMVTGTICETHKIRAILLILWHQLWSHIFCIQPICRSLPVMLWQQNDGWRFNKFATWSSNVIVDWLQIWTLTHGLCIHNCPIHLGKVMCMYYLLFS